MGVEEIVVLQKNRFRNISINGRIEDAGSSGNGGIPPRNRGSLLVGPSPEGSGKKGTKVVGVAAGIIRADVPDMILRIADVREDCAGCRAVLGWAGHIHVLDPLAFRIHTYNYRMGICGIMPEDLMNFVVKKKEESYMDKFKNQNALMKRFGEDGIKVYVVLDDRKSVGQMLQESGVDEDKFIEILDFMDSEGMVTLEHSMPETALLKPPAKQEEKKGAGARGEAGAKKAAPAAPPAKPREKAGITIAPQSFGDSFSSQEPEQEEPPEPKAAPPVPGIRKDEHTSTPIPPDYGQGKVLQTKQPAEAAVSRRSQIEITPASLETKEEHQVGKEKEAPKPEDLLSPLEKIIFDKFGTEGVEVYNLIDGEKTAEEILKETGVSESRLVEILEFMDDEGIIKLEKPGRSKGPKGLGPEAKKDVPFEPILDDREGLPSARKKDGKVEPISLPVPQPLGLLSKLETRLKLSVKYMGRGRKLYAAIDGNKDVVELAKEMRLSLEDVDKVLRVLDRRHAVVVETLSDEDVKDRYGSDGLKIFKTYGRDGILIYELIGKEKSIKDIIKRSRVEPKRAVEIVLYIHKVLGLRLPLDRHVLYSQLGIKETPT